MAAETISALLEEALPGSEVAVVDRTGGGERGNRGEMALQ